MQDEEGEEEDKDDDEEVEEDERQDWEGVEDEEASHLISYTHVHHFSHAAVIMNIRRLPEVLCYRD